MPAKTNTQENKAAAKKTTAPAAKKTTTKVASARRASKGDNFVCGTCGLSLIVDEWGDVYGEELICCGKPMKQKARKAKASAK